MLSSNVIVGLTLETSEAAAPAVGMIATTSFQDQQIREWIGACSDTAIVVGEGCKCIHPLEALFSEFHHVLLHLSASLLPLKEMG